jgi:ubiquinone biosynthesis protein COQ4
MKYFQSYRLSFLQKAFLVPYYGVGSVIDPTRGDLVAGLGDVTSLSVIDELFFRFKRTTAGLELLRAKPVITNESVGFDLLKKLPETTLGGSYYKYMTSHGFNANERSIVNYHVNSDHAYAVFRYRQIHDFWHVLSGLPPTILGELILKAFEYEITGLPSCLLAATGGQIRLSSYAEIQKYYLVGVPWAISNGSVCNALYKENPEFDVLTYPYEKNLQKSIKEVRKELKISPCRALS